MLHRPIDSCTANLAADRLPPIGRRAALQLIGGASLFLATRQAFGQDEPGPGLEPDNPLLAVTARYQALKSYSDTGTVETRYQWPGTPSLLVEHHRFETAYSAPRNFYFRFDADPASGGDAYVIWCDGGDFQSWWKATGQHLVHSNGQGAVAFLTGQSPTKDAANLVSPHLFPTAQLVGPSYRLIDPQAAGADQVEGQPCQELVAAARFTGGQTQDHRPTTVWIDDALGLVRKVHVDPEAGSAPGLIDEITYTVAPQANPAIPDNRFTFSPPAA